MADCLSPRLKLGRPRRPAFRTFTRTSPLGARLKEILLRTSKALDLQPLPLTLASADLEKLHWSLRVDWVQFHAQTALQKQLFAADAEKRRKESLKRRHSERKASKSPKALRAAKKRAWRKHLRDRSRQILEEERRYGQMLRAHEREAKAKAALEQRAPALDFQDFSFWTRHDLPRCKSEDPARILPLRAPDPEEPKVRHPYYTPIKPVKNQKFWAPISWSPGGRLRMVVQTRLGPYALDFGHRIPPRSTAS